MRVVLDTNILVSSTLGPMGRPAAIMKALQEGLYELVLSESIMDEYRDAMGGPDVRKRFRYTDFQIEEAVQGFRALSTVVEPDLSVRVAPDPDDDHIIGCAIAGEADYIVTGDNKLLTVGSYRGIQLLNPAAFLLLLEREEPRNGA
jgi:putative PIN family toxin of toxin-antitoxin system